MQTIFEAKAFQFPYRDITFPGKHTEEVILFACREARVMLKLRLSGVVAIALGLLVGQQMLENVIIDLIPDFLMTISFITSAIIAVTAVVAAWWVNFLWKHSVFLITTRRLTKFIYTTPWNRYQMSLGLDKIVDTGAYSKGFWQAALHLGTFVARSAAGNIKNFKIVNISFSEDLHNYTNKLLFVFMREKEKLNSFRPFIPHLKGEARKKYLSQVSPEYLYTPTPDVSPNSTAFNLPSENEEF